MWRPWPPVLRSARRDEYCHLTPDQISRQLRQTLMLVIRPTKFNSNILAFDIASLRQTLTQPGYIVRVTVSYASMQEADRRNCCLLRARCQRQRRGAPKETNELPPLHATPNLR